jgi:hypothetical protein
MNAVGRLLGTGSQAATYLLGGAAVILAVAAVATSASAGDVAQWIRDVLGFTFIALLGTLIFIVLFCLARLNSKSEQSDNDRVWFEAGIQAANGITTLALTFTLLGISLGIASLAEHELSPETIRDVIRDMTANFSLAFMTTVVGLPVSAVLRSILLIGIARRSDAARFQNY